MPSSVDTEVLVTQERRAELPRSRVWRLGDQAESEKVHLRESQEGFAFRVAIVGLGYVGLPTMLAFHAAGHRVVGIDISERRLAAIRAQEADLLTSDRARLAVALADHQQFVLTPDTSQVAQAETVLICVPTPIDRHLLPDLDLLRAACQMVVDQAVVGQTIIATSTTYVGCTRELLSELLEARGMVVGRDVFVAFSPERIDPGNTNHAHEAVPRVVGGITPSCLLRATSALSGYAGNLYPVTSVETAELTKLYENTFRAVNISLANEFADISSVLNVDVAEVIKAAATKPYGFMPFYPGPGIGGHCIPCDPHYLLWQLREKRIAAPIIEHAMVSAAARPSLVVRRAVEILGGVGHPIRGASILVVGVAYKPGIADVRESPALEIMRGLMEAGADVAYCDPLVSAVTVSGTTMLGLRDPEQGSWDLVIVHTAHPAVDLTWLEGQVSVLDASYRLTSVQHRHTL